MRNLNVSSNSPSLKVTCIHLYFDNTIAMYHNNIIILKVQSFVNLNTGKYSMLQYVHTNNVPPLNLNDST